MTDLQTKRSAALESSRLLRQLIESAVKFACERGARESSPLEIGTVLAQQLNEREKCQARPNKLVELIGGAGSRGGSHFIVPLGKMVGCQEAAVRLGKLSALLGDRMAGATTFGEPDINFLFDILEERQKLSSVMDTAAFAGYFSPHQHLVVSLCNYSREALVKISEQGPEVRVIKKVMEEKPWTKGEPFDAPEPASPVHTELVQLLVRLQSRMGRTKLSKALHIHGQTLAERIEGKRGVKVSDEDLLARAKALLPAFEQNGEQPSASNPVPVFKTRMSALPPPAVTPSEVRADDESGMRFVLTPENFQEHQRNLDIEFIRLAKLQMELARRALDEVTQHRDPVVRAYIRSQMMGEVHEMHFALERFSAEHPNILLEVLEAERKGFELHRKQQDSAVTRRK